MWCTDRIPVLPPTAEKRAKLFSNTFSIIPNALGKEDLIVLGDNIELSIERDCAACGNINLS